MATKKTLLDYFNINSSSPAKKLKVDDCVYEKKPADGPQNSGVDSHVDVVNQPSTSKSACTNASATVHNQLLIPEIKSKYQPDALYTFPVHKSRRCLSKWFVEFKWLHYEESKDCVLCFECIKACQLEKNMLLEQQEVAFIVDGFRNWKKGRENFLAHSNSKHHKKCIELIIQRERATSVHFQISNAHKTQKIQASHAMITVISSLRYLARTGSAIRGHGHGDVNLITLLEERQLDVSYLQVWMKKRDNWLSPIIQNEILEIMAHTVQREIIAEINESPFFGIIADSTTDVAGTEQFSLSVRHVNPNTSFKIEECFLGMYSLPGCTADIITNTIRDIIIRMNLNFNKLRGHCFDGAPNMAGHLNGAQVQISKVQPKSCFVHCSNHSLDLALQEVARKVDVMCDTIALVKDVSNIILQSAKRKNIYGDVLPPAGPQSIQQLLPLCPTRWTVKVNSMRRFKENNKRVQITLQEIHNNSKVHQIADDKRAALRGFAKKMEKVETFFFLIVAIKIFEPCEELARGLQGPQFCASGVKRAAECLKCTLSGFRTEEEFKKVYDLTLIEAEYLNLKPLKITRATRPPLRLEQTSNPSEPAILTAKDKLRMEYYTILDYLVNEINRRFNQKGLQQLVQLENIVMSSIKGEPPNIDELKNSLSVHISDFNLDQLHAQLVLIQNCVIWQDDLTVYNVGQQLQGEASTTKLLLQEVIKLIELILTVPASAASSERSFSALRRLKTYLRATMTQKRLTHLLTLHVHQERCSKIDIYTIFREFVSRNAERKSTFAPLEPIANK